MVKENDGVIAISAVPCFGCTSKESDCFVGKHGRPSRFLEATGMVCFLAVSGMDKEQKERGTEPRETRAILALHVLAEFRHQVTAGFA